ncbi:Uncharacterised protein [Mycobacteroides abscessus]|nr:Uncharacterised protein [Mycobacteroides abscessus]
MRRTPPRSMSFTPSPCWMTFSGLKSQNSRLWSCRYANAGRIAST